MSEIVKLDIQTYSQGCDSDSNPEFVQSNKGKCIDSLNMRRGSTIGNKEAKEKIGGEELLYSDFIMPDLNTVIDMNADGYTCLGFTYCKGYKIALWASETNPTAPCITIDDKVVCMSSDLGLTYNHPCQLDVNESCVGGEFFSTDFNIPPYIFNVQDMLDNYGDSTATPPIPPTDTYFSGFNSNIYTINLERQNDQPTFDEYDPNITAGNGQDYGMYIYAIQYVDASGNTSNIGQFSSMIPVVYCYSEDWKPGVGSHFWDFENYPTLLTRGADNATYSQGSKRYGIKIRYRITNTQNYDHVNIIRVAWNANLPPQTLPTAEYYTPGGLLSAGETSIRYFTDSKSIVWLPLPAQTEVDVLTSIQCAKAIRYYDNRLILMNIKYASKDLTKVNITIPEVNGEVAFPYIHNMGVIGHSDPKNTTYYKGYKAGEKYSFGILCKDQDGERTFVLPIETSYGNTIYQFPNNREALSQNSNDVSVVHGKGAVVSATINSYDNNNIATTNEIINLQARGATYDGNGILIKPTYTPKAKHPLDEQISVAWFHNWNPIHPIHQDDSNEECHQKSVTDENYKDAALSGGQAEYAYGNNVFAPEQYSKGFSITGVEGLPSWIKSFSIVRTETVGRVIAQGIAMYAFIGGHSSNKHVNKIWFYSKDIDSFSLDITGVKKLQFISPLGINTEVYSQTTTTLADMVSYARIGYNKSGSNPTNAGLLRNGTNSTEYYTEHGAWRSVDAMASNNFYDGTHIDGNKKFDIDSVTLKQLPNSRYPFYEITLLGDNIYNHSTAPAISSGAGANDTNVKQYHEPFYLVNIINDGATLPQSNMVTYYETGHHQKVESIIGTGTAAPITLQLCDERYEDCIPSQYSNLRSNIHSFVYIRNKTIGSEQRWLNITWKDRSIGGEVDTIISTLNAGNPYVIHTTGVNALYPNPYLSTQDIDIYGVYVSDWNMSSNEDGRDANVIFDNVYDSSGTVLNPLHCIPDADSYVIVKYDTRFPLKVFGGDTIISEDTTCFIDGKNDKDGQGDDTNGMQGLDTPFPYCGIGFSPYYRRVRNAKKHLEYNLGIPTGLFQTDNSFAIVWARQLAVNYFYETRVHMPYSYNEITGSSGWYYHTRRNFPRTHYIMRPMIWDDSPISNNFSPSDGSGHGAILMETNNSGGYDETMNYPLEHTMWGYGGFICNNLPPAGTLGAIFNLDYQKTNNYLQETSKPTVGWHEITDYCTRIIWSERRNIAQQNVPNLKTFLSTSILDIVDAYGEIKYAYDAETSKGDNLYAFTNTGIALILTGKEISSDATGSQVALITVGSRFLAGNNTDSCIWLRTDCGMYDEMWRSVAEWAKVIFWSNNESAFMMFDNKISDIGKTGYYRRLYYDGLTNVKSGYDSIVSAVFDRLHGEYWLNLAQKPTNLDYMVDLLPSHIGNAIILGETATTFVTYLVTPNDWLNITNISLFPTVNLPTDFLSGDQITITNSTNSIISVRCGTVYYYNLTTGDTQTFIFDGHTYSLVVAPKLNETFVFAVEGDGVIPEGTYSYKYDKYICQKDVVYGVKDGVIYVVNTGLVLNNANITAELTQVCNAAKGSDKEFISFLTQTVNKPTAVQFANSLGAMPECELSLNLPVLANSRYLKQYGFNKWTNKIPRKAATGRFRVQGDVLIFKIIHSAAEPFVVENSIVDYKPLKLIM